MRRGARDLGPFESVTARREAVADLGPAKESTKPASAPPQSASIFLPLVVIACACAAASCGLQVAEQHIRAAPTEFNVSYASGLLRSLIDEGPRVAASAHTDRVNRFLAAEFEDISRVAKVHGATLEVSRAMGSGAFQTDFIEGFTNVYQNITSVVARLSWPGSSRDAVLVNAHYDSFPGSPGASDDGIHVALALGMARSLASGTPQSASVIFLLNGGEESNWVAAHAFARNHPWAHDYRVVFNLESIGAGGEAIIFQIGPDAAALSGALRSARGTRGSAVAHDLFQIPGFPAGTDMKTLIAHAPSRRRRPPPIGIDLAILGDGYVYHTPTDDIAHVPEAQVRELGARVTSILRALLTTLEATHDSAQADAADATGPADASGAARASSDNPQRIDGDTHAVFFDIGGVVWISYSRTSARMIHLLAGVLALGAVHVTTARPSLLARELFALLASVAVAAAVGGVLWHYRPMACYGSHTLALALYAPLALAVALAIRDRAFPQAAATTAPLPSVSSTTVRSLGAAALLPWLLALTILEAGGLGSAYLPAMVCACNGAGLLLAQRLAAPGGSPATSAMSAATAQVLGALLPALHLSDLLGWLVEVLIPITGRSGVVIPSDIVIAVIMALITALCGGTLTAVLHTSRYAVRRVCGGLVLMSALSAYAALERSTIFHAAAPKRLLVHHVAREVNGEPYDAGLWISAFDVAGLRELRRVPAKQLGVPAIHGEEAHACDLDLPSTGCYFSFPYFWPLHPVIGAPDGLSSVYATKLYRGLSDGARSPNVAPVEPPPIAFVERLRLERFVTVNASGGVSRLSLRITGPSHMGLVLPEGRLAAWSLTPTAPPPRRSSFAPDERVVFAFATNGGMDGRGEPNKARIWDFWVEVVGHALLEFVVYGHYVESRSPELDELLPRMPPGVREGTWHWFPSILSRWTLRWVDGRWQRLS